MRSLAGSSQILAPQVSIAYNNQHKDHNHTQKTISSVVLVTLKSNISITSYSKK
jgi:hypothetical protein